MNEVSFSLMLIVITMIVFLILALQLYYSNQCSKSSTNSSYFSVPELYKNYENSNHFINYLESIHFNMHSKKINDSSISWELIKNLSCSKKYRHLKKEYISKLKKIPSKYNYMLNFYTNKCNQFLKKYKIFFKYKWDFLMSVDGLELNMPFTIDKKIILPIYLLESIYLDFKNNFDVKMLVSSSFLANQKLNFKPDSNFINTLIHEKIHIIQRFNQDTFNSFYMNEYKSFLKNRFDEKSIPEYISKKHMNNPDSNNQYWVYMDYSNPNDRYYLPLLIYKNKNVKNYGYFFKSKKLKNINYLRKKLGYKKDVSFYHPNEIFACELSRQLIENKISKSYSKFLISKF